MANSELSRLWPLPDATEHGAVTGEAIDPLNTLMVGVDFVCNRLGVMHKGSFMVYQADPSICKVWLTKQVVLASYPDFSDYTNWFDFSELDPHVDDVNSSLSWIRFIAYKERHTKLPVLLAEVLRNSGEVDVVKIDGNEAADSNLWLYENADQIGQLISPSHPLFYNINIWLCEDFPAE